MIYGKLHTIRDFFRRARNAEPGALRRKTALFLSALMLAGLAQGQAPTVASIPYVLAGNTFHVVPNTVVVPVPANTGTGFASLMGGGLSSILSTITGPAAESAAIAGLIQIAKARQAATIARQKDLIKAQNAARQEQERLQAEQPDEEESFEEAQQNVEEQQQNLQALAESEEVGEAQIEDAEIAVEGAQIAEEVAEEAVEAVEITIDVAEAIFDIIDGIAAAI